ncbi:MAG TPA: RluA family pseudouridine synthase [Solibacterales bacterium]|nr:RluA family pseudouridine synthase [Bryobacterales bacterium]
MRDDREALQTHPEDRGKRLDSLLQERLPQYSRSRLQTWIKAGLVTVDGAPQRASYTIRGGEAIAVTPADLPPLRAEAEAIELSVLYEDDALIAIDKPAGMVVHAGAGVHSGTLANALVHRFQSLSSLGGEQRPGIVHRLDRYTSGVILVAKTDTAHHRLAAQFAARETRKIYLAMVHRAMPAMAGRIEKPIARDPVHRTRMTARLALGRAAITEYRVLQQYRLFSYLEVRILTGRTHQIRVHLASIGHPVAGDRLYGAPAAVPGIAPLERYFLHAHQISFAHPLSGEPLTIRSPLPADLAAWKAGLPDVQ